MSYRGVRGFTLIELMIVIAVLGILLLIALPAYNSQIRHSRRGDAITALGTLSLLQESFRATNATYGATLAAINGTGPANLAHYTVTIGFTGAGNDGTNYVLTATAIAGDDQNNDRSGGSPCGTLTYTYDSTANPQISKAPASCWK